MADQAGSGALANVPQESGATAGAATAGLRAHEAFHGRPVSWVAVSIIMVGFLVGGLGLVFGPSWPLFWVGAALAVLGGLIALGTGILNDWY